MSAPRPVVTPAMQAWIDEQKKHFSPNAMDPVVRMMRAWEREDAEKAQQGSAA